MKHAFGPVPSRRLGRSLRVDPVSIITRHALTEKELLGALARQEPEGVLEALAELSGSGMAKTVERFNSRFWCAAGADFPDEGPSTVEASTVAHVG